MHDVNHSSLTDFVAFFPEAALVHSEPVKVLSMKVTDDGRITVCVDAPGSLMCLTFFGHGIVRFNHGGSGYVKTYDAYASSMGKAGDMDDTRGRVMQMMFDDFVKEAESYNE